MEISPLNISLICLLGFAVLYLFFMIVKNNTTQTEHFENEDYGARLDVMKVFDLVLSRKPSKEEIDKYSVYKSEQDILLHVLQDFQGQGKSSTSPNTTTSTNAPSSDTAMQSSDTTAPSSKTPVDSESQPTVPTQEELDSAVTTLSEVFQKKKPDDSIIPNMSLDGEKVCMNKHYVNQMLDDIQAKIDVVRVFLK